MFVVCILAVNKKKYIFKENKLYKKRIKKTLKKNINASLFLNQFSLNEQK